MLAALAAMCLSLGACQFLAKPQDGVPVGPVADGALWLEVGNFTDRVVQLAVNGVVVADVQPSTTRTVFAAQLPPLPWRAEVRLPAGRTLVALTLESGQVIKTQDGWRSVGNRVDLSCGRIDIYSMVVMMGPAPGPGVPGDCNP